MAATDPSPHGPTPPRLLPRLVLLAVPILGCLTLVLLQYSGQIRLEEYFDPDHPERVDRAVLYWALILPALILTAFRGVPLTLAWLRRRKKAPPSIP